MSKIIDTIKETIQSESFKTKYRLSEKAFIRERKLPFSVVILFQLSMLQLSLQSELNNFYKHLLGGIIPCQKVSDAAFCKARKKCKPQAFLYLLHTLADLFYRFCQAPLWKGMRLVAIDGTTLYLPKYGDIPSTFGEQSTADADYVLAQASFAYDPYSHVVIDAQIDRYKESEQNLFYRHSERFSTSDLILADRGYTGFWLMALMVSKGCHFCIRHQTVNTYSAIKTFIQSGEKQRIVNLKPSRKSIPHLKEKNLSLEEITVRLIRIELPKGEIEVLVTNLLDEKRFPHKGFKELYHLRWPVEESYKSFKSRLKVENFTGKSAQIIKQDFFAKTFILSFSAILEHAAQPLVEKTSLKNEGKTEYKRQINRTALLNVLKNTFVELFIKTKQIKCFLQEIIRTVAQNTEAIRPDRSCTRKHKTTTRYYMNYKPAF